MWSLRKPNFKCFWILNDQISDPHWIKDIEHSKTVQYLVRHFLDNKSIISNCDTQFLYHLLYYHLKLGRLNNFNHSKTRHAQFSNYFYISSGDLKSGIVKTHLKESDLQMVWPIAIVKVVDNRKSTNNHNIS